MNCLMHELLKHSNLSMFCNPGGKINPVLFLQTSFKLIMHIILAYMTMSDFYLKSILQLLWPFFSPNFQEDKIVFEISVETLSEPQASGRVFH